MKARDMAALREISRATLRHYDLHAGCGAASSFPGIRIAPNRGFLRRVL
jgi:hypothetical protein